MNTQETLSSYCARSIARREFKSNVKLITELGPRVNHYRVVIDGETFCYTSNDDNGLKLGIAIAILELRRSLKN
jgi:hypothetical protein